ncbi:MAG TPA: PepSY-like domain-containing protein [Chitinophagaceae bacterium]|nr:PepSY-like domain-containing protein [Chitinophagaceae bacterium]
MKLRLLTVAAGLAVLASCGPSYRVTNGTTVGIDVPNSVHTTFVTAYPNASDVVWSMYDATLVPIDVELAGWPDLDQNDYVATFYMNGDKYYAYYDPNGDWVGTAYAITDYKSLPVSINTMITDKYPGYTITNVDRVMQKNRVAYEIQMKNGNSKAKIFVDENGNIIKEKTVTK